MMAAVGQSWWGWADYIEKEIVRARSGTCKERQVHWLLVVGLRRWPGDLESTLSHCLP